MLCIKMLALAFGGGTMTGWRRGELLLFLEILAANLFQILYLKNKIKVLRGFLRFQFN